MEAATSSKLFAPGLASLLGSRDHKQTASCRDLVSKLLVSSPLPTKHSS